MSSSTYVLRRMLAASAPERYPRYHPIEELQGMTFVSVRHFDEAGCNECVEFISIDNRWFLLVHEQECSESVWIEDFEGEWEDLVGSPIIRAEEGTGEMGDREDVDEWTFYDIGTVKGTVWMRWAGESNGYYSTGVDLLELEPLRKAEDWFLVRPGFWRRVIIGHGIAGRVEVRRRRRKGEPTSWEGYLVSHDQQREISLAIAATRKECQAETDRAVTNARRRARRRQERAILLAASCGHLDSE